MSDEAYKIVEDTLREAVKTSESPEHFAHNLHLCQLVAQRMLAVLIFNSARQGDAKADQLIEKVGIGILSELKSMEAAAADEKNLAQIDVEFKAKNEH